MMTNEVLLQRNVLALKSKEECNLRNLNHWTFAEYQSKANVMIVYFTPKPLSSITDDELQDILLEHATSYKEQHFVSYEQEKVMNALMKCRTASLGGHATTCDDCSRHTKSSDSAKPKSLL